MMNQIAVIKTKIMIPRRRKEILSRPRLLDFLQNIIDVKLLILAAPAGYGKTSLLVDYSEHTKLPVCWLSLDSLDCDPQRFIAHFIASLMHVFPSFGKQAQSALAEMNQDRLNYDPVIAAIVNDAYENITEHFVFTIEDYHLVRDSKQIEPFINRIIQEMAENCHFIISSRVLLTLPDLSLLVARNQVSGLSFEELAFLPEEVKQLLAENYHQTITDAYAEELITQTEGWITGLLLSTQLSPKSIEDRARLTKVAGIGVYEYLAQQVFNRQPEEIQQFLLRTSLLEEFDAQLCELVIGRPLRLEHYPWHERISRVLRDNLFVLSVGEETLFIRYHHLFHDFLQNRMRLQLPEETEKIERSLSQYYQDQQQWERAFEILNRLGDQTGIYKLIYRAAPLLINSGKLITLSNWFDSLADEKIKSAPELLSIQATIASVRGKMKESMELFDRAIAGLREDKKDIDLSRSLNRRSLLQNHMGDYSSALKDAEEAIAITKDRNGMEAIRAEAFRARGLSLFQQGDLLGALESLKDARYLFDSFGQKDDIAGVLMEMGLAQRRLGNFDSAEIAYQEALKQWQSSGNSMWQANVLNNLGFLQNLRGQYEQAALSLERALQHARLALYPRSEGFILISLGDLFRDLTSFEEASQVYDMAGEIATALDEPGMIFYLTLSSAVLKRVEGKYEEAEKGLEAARMKAKKGGSGYEVNICKLEKLALDLRTGNKLGIDEELAELAGQFSHQNETTEALRTKLLFAVACLEQEKNSDAQRALQEVRESRLLDSARNILVQIGVEFSDIFEEAVVKLGSFEPLNYIRELVSDFDKKIPEIRKNIRRQNSVIQFNNYQLSIRAFGKMQVKVGDHLVSSSDWQSQTSRDLLFYIIAHPGGVTKEEVGGVFWPDSSLDELRIRFKNAIYRLRRAVGNDAVTYTNEIYEFNRSIDFDYDAERFTRELAMAQASNDPDGKIKHLKAALTAYQGTFLPKIEQTWVFSQRQAYEQQFIDAGLLLANLLLQQGYPGTALQYTKRVVEQDSCNEAAYRINMQAFAAQGDRSSIKRTYEFCRQTLMNELGVEPGDITRDLFESLMR
jgi:ATP/maltotriose-dependent transcriptional regulator MalT/two-component SAPR family response regulator